MSEGSADPLDQPSPRRAERSRLALSSGVMGLVSLPFFCCGSGLAGALATALGVVALERIASTGGVLRGKAWAWTGIVSGILSVALSLAWMSVANAALEQWNRQLDDGLRATFGATTGESAREALRSWASKSGPGVSASTVADFAKGVHERLGELQSVSLVSQDASAGSLDALVVVHVVNLEFEKASRSAVVSTELRTPVLEWTPKLKLVKIYVNDAELPGGAVEFPAPLAKGESTASASTRARDKEVAP